jgi:hypothetical protein
MDAENANRSVLHVRHSELRRVSEGSSYRSECPACSDGLLLVRRDDKTFVLLREDMCVSCGQIVVYDDQEINGELLHSESNTAN